MRVDWASCAGLIEPEHMAGLLGVVEEGAAGNAMVTAIPHLADVPAGRVGALPPGERAVKPL